MGSIPGWVKLDSIKYVFTASPQDVQQHRNSMKPPPSVVDRWQLDSKTEKFLCCLLATKTCIIITTTKIVKIEKNLLVWKFWYLGEDGSLPVAIWVRLWCPHVPFCIRSVILLPAHNWGASNRHLKHGELCKDSLHK